MYYSKDIESFGTGLKRIADACDKSGVKYEFRKLKSGFVVCFYRLEGKTDKKADKKPIKADKKPIKNDRQKMIMQYVKQNGSITNREARELLSLADSTVKRILKTMVENGLLIVEGEHRARRYLLK